MPKPEVLPPEPQDGDAPRIGYFPDEILGRIAEIQRLKKQGWSMTRIAEHFGTRQPPAATGAQSMAATTPPATAREAAGPADSPAAGPRLEIVRKRPPVLTQVAVLVAGLQHSTRIWSELPPEDYFDLINDIWEIADPIFRRHWGTDGKHPGDGMVAYFFPMAGGSYLWNALAAAHELREAMRRASKDWQLRKSWNTELYMNIGIDEGQEWLGTFKSASKVEFTALAETINQAARISDFSRHGAIWATKNLVGKLSAAERERLKYGVRRRNNEGEHVFVASVFSDVLPLTHDTAGMTGRLDIAMLPITEIIEITPDPGR